MGVEASQPPMDEIGAPDAEAIAFSGVFRMFGAGQLIVGAREKAELPHNLKRAGIPRKVAMQMVGHRTESMLPAV